MTDLPHVLDNQPAQQNFDALKADLERLRTTVTTLQASLTALGTKPPVIAGTIRGSDGAILAGSGFSVSRTGTGLYTITYGTAFSAAPHLAYGLGDAADIGAVKRQGTSNSANPVGSISVATYNSSFGSPADLTFSFIAVGPA